MVEGWLEREVEIGQRLDHAQARHLQRRLDSPSLARVSSSASRAIDRLQGVDLAALDLTHDMVEHLERTRDAQPGQVATHPFEGGGDRTSSLMTGYPSRSGAER